MPLPFLSAESQQQGLPDSLTILRMIPLLSYHTFAHQSS